MDSESGIFEATPPHFRLADVAVRLAEPHERRRWDALMDRHHYLGFKRFAGRGLRCVFEWRGRWVGLAGWQSGALPSRLPAQSGKPAERQARAPLPRWRAGCFRGCLEKEAITALS